jgi:hypothetical protein
MKQTSNLSLSMHLKAKLIVFTLLLVLIGETSYAAAPKAGLKCSKSGVSAVSQGKKFTCIKSGNKLIWNKGVSIPKVVPNPTPANTPAPVQKVSLPKPGDAPLRPEGCGNGTFYYRINDGVMERSFFEDKEFTSSDTRPESTFNPIRAKAFKAVRDQFEKSKITQARIQSTISPTFPQDLLNVLQKQLNQNVAFWGEYFPAGSTVQSTYFTGDDPTFADNSKLTMSGALEPYFLEELKKYKQYNCSLRNGVSGGHLVNKGPFTGQSGYWFGASSAPQKTYWAPWYQPHELTHSVQALIVKDVFSVTLPMNFFEGGAEFFGQAMGYSNLAWYSDEVDKGLIEKHINEFIMDVKTKEDVVRMLQITETNSGPVAGGSQVPNAMRWAYTMGNLLWEWVTAEYGYEAYWKILKSVNINRSYEQAVKESLGITKLELYEKSAPYILSQFEGALTKNWKDSYKRGS